MYGYAIPLFLLYNVSLLIVARSLLSLAVLSLDKFILSLLIFLFFFLAKAITRHPERNQRVQYDIGS